MAEKADAYFSYLLRLWRDDSADRSTWRASLESAQTAERHHFATLDDLFTFLRERANAPAASGPETQRHNKEV
jgi:hypothetical protein